MLSGEILDRVWWAGSWACSNSSEQLQQPVFELLLHVSRTVNGPCMLVVHI